MTKNRIYDRLLNDKAYTHASHTVSIRDNAFTNPLRQKKHSCVPNPVKNTPFLGNTFVTYTGARDNALPKRRTFVHNSLYGSACLYAILYLSRSPVLRGICVVSLPNKTSENPCNKLNTPKLGPASLSNFGLKCFSGKHFSALNAHLSHKTNLSPHVPTDGTPQEFASSRDPFRPL